MDIMCKNILFIVVGRRGFNFMTTYRAEFQILILIMIFKGRTTVFHEKKVNTFENILMYRFLRKFNFKIHFILLSQVDRY